MFLLENIIETVFWRKKSIHIYQESLILPIYEKCANGTLPVQMPGFKIRIFFSCSIDVKQISFFNKLYLAAAQAEKYAF